LYGSEQRREHELWPPVPKATGVPALLNVCWLPLFLFRVVTSLRWMIIMMMKTMSLIDMRNLLQFEE
jgi:hypothetical protein